jgi:phosphomethylpyrimidine synthase
LRILEAQARRGIDLITVHASALKQHFALVAESKRLIPTTSKGGGIVADYIHHTGRENPYFEGFDELLDIFRDFNVTLSLGTTFRPASVCDSWDFLLAAELETMGELTARALHKGVNVMVEGIGHAPVSAIPTHVKLAKKYCKGVPYRLLPMATDAALGFDHISGAIATSFAVAAGADAVTCMSRAEHIGLPTAQDLEEAIISTRIAAHCGDLVKLANFSLDRQISTTRWKQGCKGDWQASIYPAGARMALESRGRLHDQMIQCGMCSEFCGITAGIAIAKRSER